MTVRDLIQIAHTTLDKVMTGELDDQTLVGFTSPGTIQSFEEITGWSMGVTKDGKSKLLAFHNGDSTESMERHFNSKN